MVGFRCTSFSGDHVPSDVGIASRWLSHAVMLNLWTVPSGEVISINVPQVVIIILMLLLLSIVRSYALFLVASKNAFNRPAILIIDRPLSTKNGDDKQPSNHIDNQ